MAARSSSEVDVDAVYEQTWPEGRTLPLNSRRLDAWHLQQLAVLLELPRNAFMDDTQQMIDRKLTEMGMSCRKSSPVKLVPPGLKQQWSACRIGSALPN